MTRDQCKTIFGSQTELARALGVTKACVSQWLRDGQLNEAHTDRVIGAAIRLGKPVPADVLMNIKRAN